MSSDKKAVRINFRSGVLERDKYKCRCCGVDGYDRQAEPVDGKVPLDAHHITDRSIMPKGGYVKENGISVCDECHVKAEKLWSGGTPPKGYMPEDLYELIGSSYEEAFKASEKLGKDRP